MLDEIVKRIKSLPPLPKSFYEVESVCSDPNGTIEKLAKVIEEDPMIVANLLKIANSPLYGFRREIKSILQAVSLFGMNTTKALIADISIRKLLSVDMEPYGITPEEFAHISHLQSNLMMKWYRRVDAKKIDILFLSALLQETGKILIADEIVRNDETYQFKSEIETAIDISSVEKAYVGATTAEVTSKIFEHWGFEENMVNIIKFSDNYLEEENLKEYSFALKVVKSAVPINSPLSQRSLNIATSLLEKEGYDVKLFEEAVLSVEEGK